MRRSTNKFPLIILLIGITFESINSTSASQRKIHLVNIGWHVGIIVPVDNILKRNLPETFDFSDPDFWSKIAQMSDRLANDEYIRKLNGNRRSRHFLYINRTFFGLYNLMHDLKAKVVVDNYKQYI